MMKSLPIRTQSFVALRRNNRYYVDKTAFIKRVLVDDSADVLLITRPRRFGKTLFMDTLNILHVTLSALRDPSVSLGQARFFPPKIKRP